MGSDAHVITVDGPRDAIPLSRRRLADLEGRWSRFRLDSEVNRLNRAGGRWVPVSPETALLLACGVDGWRRTGGAFDPTVLDALEASGYDRSFDELIGDGPAAGRVQAAPGLAGLEVDAGMARLPAGHRFDPGGIGKGLAADLVVTELLEAGAAGALVSVGGDLRVAGRPPDGDGWSISLAPDGAAVGGVLLVEGGVASSTVRLRQWTRAGQPQHHLIDPAAGQPARHGPAAVSVVAGAGWLAEVLTKVVMLRSRADGAAAIEAAGATALAIEHDGHATALGRMHGVWSWSR